MIRHPLPPPASDIRQDDIRHCAYFLWLAAGRPAGRDLEFWFTAREWLHYAPRSRRARAGQKVRTGGQDARSDPAGHRLR
jgi:hypothetical protein